MMSYRGIALLNTMYKVFFITIYNRIHSTLQEIGKYQLGFSSRYQKKVLERQNGISHTLVDFKAAYNNIIEGNLRWKKRTRNTFRK